MEQSRQNEALVYSLSTAQSWPANSPIVIVIYESRTVSHCHKQPYTGVQSVLLVVIPKLLPEVVMSEACNWKLAHPYSAWTCSSKMACADSKRLIGTVCPYIREQIIPSLHGGQPTPQDAVCTSLVQLGKGLFRIGLKENYKQTTHSLDLNWVEAVM